jgi:hypothetical protein
MFDIEKLYLNNMAVYPRRKKSRLFGSFQEILQITFKIQKKNYMIIDGHSNARDSKTRVKDILRIFGEEINNNSKYLLHFSTQICSNFKITVMFHGHKDT